MIKLAERRILPPLSLATHTDVLSGHHSFLPHERISGCKVQQTVIYGKETCDKMKPLKHLPIGQATLSSALCYNNRTIAH